MNTTFIHWYTEAVHFWKDIFRKQFVEKNQLKKNFVDGFTDFLLLFLIWWHEIHFKVTKSRYGKSIIKLKSVSIIS